LRREREREFTASIRIRMRIRRIEEIELEKIPLILATLATFHKYSLSPTG
jgi:hypothetical protein